MKTKVILWSCAVAVLSGCNQAVTEPQSVSTDVPVAVASPDSKPKPLTIADDFVMGSPTAVSNALHFGNPPEGWTIKCNAKGQFVPAHGDFAYAAGANIRTNAFEATVAAWRIMEVLEGFKQQETTLEQINREQAEWTVCK